MNNHKYHFFKAALFFIVLFIISGCTKNASQAKESLESTDPILSSSAAISDTDNRNDPGETEEQPSISFETNNELVEGQEIGNDENLKHVEVELKDLDNFLSQYFFDNNYILFEEPLNVNYRNIYFAAQRIKEKPVIYDIIVGYENIDGVYHRYLLIKDFKFINEDESILKDFSIGYERIYGFNFIFSYPKVEGYTPGLVIETYFDEGARPADDFTIEWDEDKKQFRSQIYNR
jgi:hypothetical protein